MHRELQQRLGPVVIEKESGSAALEWSVPSGRGRFETHSTPRGDLRLVVTMPVHARPKVFLLATLLTVVSLGVMTGLLGLAAGEDPLSAIGVAFAAVVAILVGSATAWGLGSTTETVVLDSRLLTATDTPFDFAVMRRDIAGFSEYGIGGAAPSHRRWTHPRIAIEPAQGASAALLPLAGSALNDEQLSAVLLALNEFIAGIESDEEFAREDVAAYPAIVTLTDPR